MWTLQVLVCRVLPSTCVSVTAGVLAVAVKFVSAKSVANPELAPITSLR